MLAEVSGVVRRERRAQRRDGLGQIVVDGHVAERRLPRPAGPDSHTTGEGLMVGAGKDDRGRADLAGKRPAQGRDRARVDEPGMRDQESRDGCGIQAIGPRGPAGARQQSGHQRSQSVGLGGVERASDRGLA